MNLQKAISRLKYTTENGNKSNGSDKEALEVILNEIYKKKAIKKDDNILFKKLFIGILKHELVKSNGDYQIAFGIVKTILRIDIDEHFTSFAREVNQLEFESYCEYIGLSLKHPAMKTDAEELEDDAIIKANAEKLSEVLTHFSEKKITNRLNVLIDKSIEDYE